MSRYKVIFECQYVTDAVSSEEATQKALQNIKNIRIEVADVKLLSYGLGGE